MACGEFVLSLAEEDPGLLSSSLVLRADQQPQRDKRGKLMVDASGDQLPPIWMPLEITGSDVVAVGDAVGSLLSAQGEGHSTLAEIDSKIAEQSEAYLAALGSKIDQWAAEDARGDQAERLAALRIKVARHRSQLAAGRFWELLRIVDALPPDVSDGAIEQAEVGVASAIWTCGQNRMGHSF